MTPAGLAGTQRWFLRTGLFLLPLAFWWDTYDQYVLPKVLVARVLVIGLLILFIARTLATRTLFVKRTGLDLPLVAFLASALLSTVFAENQNVALFGIYSRYDGLITLVTYAALFWLSAQAIDGPADARAVIRALLVSGYLVAALAIAQSMNDSLGQGSLAEAFGTLGQHNVLGAFLAMLAPLAYRELVVARGWSGRILALNALVVIGTALLLSLSRSAWLGSAIAAIVILAGTRGAAARYRLAGAGALVVAGAAVAALNAGGRLFEQSVAARALTVFDPSVWSPRSDIWRDSFKLIASSPLVGYGPDNFGLVYPRFQAHLLGLLQIDKAHSEAVQVAATQGLIGLAAYLVLLAAFVRAFLPGRHREGAVPIIAAWLGYQITLQLNFSALAASFPFWVFAAAAMESWGDTRPWLTVSLGAGRALTAAASMLIIALGGLAVTSTVIPYLADAHLLRAVNADYARRTVEAGTEAIQARQLAPEESVYAVEVGNVAFERSDWAAARLAYADASTLGTYNPLVYRNLALTDRNLGLWSEAEAAARKAVELDRFDPANIALVAQLEATAP